MRTVVELMETTVRSLTDSNRPEHACTSSIAILQFRFCFSRLVVVYLVPVVVLDHFHPLIMVLN